MRGKIICLFFVMVLSGCAPTTKWSQGDNFMVAAEREKQMTLAFEMQMNEQCRLTDVGSSVLSGAVDLCGEKIKPTVGIIWFSKDELKGPMREAAIKHYNLTENKLVVVDAGKYWPAYKAGIRINDQVLSINGSPVTSMMQSSKIMQDAIKDKGRWPINIMVLRDGKEISYAITPQPSCDYPVGLVDQEAVNAYADGKKIYVTRGMMRFINEDRELALVVAHELAHNTMGHISKKTGNALLGALVDGFAAAYGVNTQGTFTKAAGNAYSQDFEMEADYVGLYAMAKSGFDVSDAANFWRRMGATNPGSISQQKGYFSSHPSSPERFVAIDKAAAEIKAKRAAGKPLTPEMKEQQSSLAEQPAKK